MITTGLAFINKEWAHLQAQWLSSAINKPLCHCLGGRIHKHRRQPLITNGIYNVTGLPQDIGGSRSPRLIKAHGKLQLLVLSSGSRLAETGELSFLHYCRVGISSYLSGTHYVYCWLARFETVKTVKLLLIFHFKNSVTRFFLFQKMNLHLPSPLNL